MDSQWLHFSLVLLLCSNYVHGQGKIFSVTKYGAVSDGKTDTSKALLSAWKDACRTRGGAVLVPTGTYVVSDATFQGPCNGETRFINQGTIKATPGAHFQDSWITFYEVDGLTIYGRGTFDGNGASAWSIYLVGNGASAWSIKKSCDDKCGHRPTSIKITKVKNLKIQGISSLNSKEFHFHVLQSENVVVNNVNIVAPGNSPNTDGIHISRSSNVSVTNSRISTGDDCISMGDGNNNILIDSIMCGPGHGISIGSLGKYPSEEDVRGITVRNCTLINTTNGLRIKTWAPSSVSSTVSDVTFENINLRNVQNPIFINQFYCPDSPCSHQRNSDIEINGVKFINIKGTSASPVAVDLLCSKSHPCQNLELHGIELTGVRGEATTAVCSNAHIKSFDSDGNPRTCTSVRANWIY